MFVRCQSWRSFAFGPASSGLGGGTGFAGLHLVIPLMAIRVQPGFNILLSHSRLATVGIERNDTQIIRVLFFEVDANELGFFFFLLSGHNSGFLFNRRTVGGRLLREEG